MCATDLTFQEFVVEGDEFLELQKEFMKRVELYYQLQAKGQFYLKLYFRYLLYILDEVFGLL